MRAQLNQRVPMGSVIKCRRSTTGRSGATQGLTGQATSDTGPVKLTFDNTPPDGSPGVLLGFIEGQRRPAIWRRPRRTTGERPCSGRSTRYFGPRPQPAPLRRKDWADEVWTPRLLRGLHAARACCSTRATRCARPSAAIHWAGTETATGWAGYMDGAVESGQRAAAEVLAGSERGRSVK